MKKKQGLVIHEYQAQRAIAQDVARLFGTRVPILEKRTLIKDGKPLASTYIRKR